MTYRVNSIKDPLCVSMTGESLPELVFRFCYLYGLMPLLVLRSPHPSCALDGFSFDRVLTKRQCEKMIDLFQDSCIKRNL